MVRATSLYQSSTWSHSADGRVFEREHAPSFVFSSVRHEIFASDVPIRLWVRHKQLEPRVHDQSDGRTRSASNAMGKLSFLGADTSDRSQRRDNAFPRTDYRQKAEASAI